MNNTGRLGLCKRMESHPSFNYETFQFDAVSGLVHEKSHLCRGANGI